MKPHLGIWQGTFVSSTVAVPISIILEQVNDNGTLAGSFEVLSEDWEGQDDGKFEHGSYSVFGSIHLEQENVVVGKDYHDKITFDGRFDVPDKSIGAIWGTVRVYRQEHGNHAQTEVTTGSMVAAFAGPKPPPEKFQDNLWND